MNNVTPIYPRRAAYPREPTVNPNRVMDTDEIAEYFNISVPLAREIARTKGLSRRGANGRYQAPMKRVIEWLDEDARKDRQ